MATTQVCRLVRGRGGVALCGAVSLPEARHNANVAPLSVAVTVRSGRRSLSCAHASCRLAVACGRDASRSGRQLGDIDVVQLDGVREAHPLDLVVGDAV